MCTHNLQSFTEVIADNFPQPIVQKCIVHQVCNSLKYVDEKDKKKITTGHRKVYTAISREEPQSALASFEKVWGEKYDYIVKQWKYNWEELIA